jgi:hypothetical protein
LFGDILITLAQNLPVDPVGAQAFQEMVGQMVGLLLVTASEDIQNQIAVLRPGMQRNVGLGEQGKSRDALGVELMKPGAQIGESNLFYRALYDLMEKFTGIDLFLFAAVQLEHEMVSVRPRILDQELPFHGQSLPYVKIWLGRFSPLFPTPLGLGFEKYLEMLTQF